MTLAAAPPTDVAPRTSSEAFIAIPEHLHCPNCDHDVTNICTAALARAQEQLQELEEQVQILNKKATAAVDRWGDYEDQLHTLRKQLQEAHSARSPTPIPTPTQSRFSFLSPRKQAPPSSLPTPQHSPHQSTSTSTTSLTPSAAALLPPPLPEKDGPVSVGGGGIGGVHRSYPNPLDLASAEISDLSGKLSAVQTALRHESLLRQQAEEKALAGGRELEDLTAQLFEEANRMVADERKQKAKLESRLKILEEREVQRKGKLEMIEAAQVRIERVQTILGPKGEVGVVGEKEVVSIKPGRVIGRKSIGGNSQNEEKAGDSGAS